MKIAAEVIDFQFDTFTLPKSAKVINVFRRAGVNYFNYSYDEHEKSKAEVVIQTFLTGNRITEPMSCYVGTCVMDQTELHVFVRYLK